MRILQIVPLFGPKHGGTSASTLALSMELASRGHQVTIATTDYLIDQKLLQMAQQYLCVEVFRSLIDVASFYYTPTLKSWVFKNIHNFDIVHLNDYRTYQNVVVANASKAKGVPYVFQARGSLPVIFGKATLKKTFDLMWGDKIIYGASKAIVSTSIEARNHALSRVKKENIKVIPNGIRTADYENLPKMGNFLRKNGIDNKPFRILYLGRLHPVKGIDVLIRALHEIKKSTNDFSFILVGPDSGYLKEVEKLIKLFDLKENYVRIESLAGPEKIEAFVDSNVVVMPSRYESFGNVAIESMASGTPVIVSNVCGCSEIVKTSGGGLIFSSEDNNDLAKCILQLERDPEHCRDLGKSGQRYVVHHLDYSLIAKSVEQTYVEALSRL